ncbi:hypothetical protein [Erythrobacter aureus]|uniref:Uncharacterized protein n=1 Tax=Erythrobacter aureus TaxID=2182384 RepID=A0A345YIV6_9SPHN|nr:hypothetical protein [Erythrobacter aureus]AXK43858.1 hypothetical protein DVR09_15500 [Erythrobacter aureus]
MIYCEDTQRAEEMREHRHDIEKIAAVITASGRPTTLDEAYDAWRSYSDSMCAGWMRVPDDDDDEIIYYAKSRLPDASAQDAFIIENDLLSYRDDIVRIAAALMADGRQVSLREAYQAWMGYSDSMCAGWMMLPETDREIANCASTYLGA